VKYKLVTSREVLVDVLEGKEPQRVAWWPRIKHWYDINNSMDTIPEKYKGWYMEEIYEDLNAIPRQLWTGVIFGGGEFGGYFNITTREGSDVDIWVKTTKGLYYRDIPGDFIILRYTTPVGDITQVGKRTERGTSVYPVEYFLKDQKSIDVYKYVLEHRSYQFDWQHYKWGEKRYGHQIYPRGVIQRPPVLRLVIGMMGLNRTVIWLWKHPKEMEELMELMTQDVEKQVAAYVDTPVVELCPSSNQHEDFCLPSLYKKFVVPFWHRISRQAHNDGKYVSAHWDGFVEQILPLLKETGLDGVECVTPKPQGDVTLEQMKKYIIDEGKFLRDGIPAILFTKRYPVEQLEAFTRRILDMLGKSGRLQLGISEELPGNGDIDRVRLVSTIVEEWNEKNFG
jgi:hypothetical protein